MELIEPPIQGRIPPGRQIFTLIWRFCAQNAMGTKPNQRIFDGCGSGLNPVQRFPASGGLKLEYSGSKPIHWRTAIPGIENPGNQGARKTDGTRPVWGAGQTARLSVCPLSPLLSRADCPRFVKPSISRSMGGLDHGIRKFRCRRP